MQSLTRTATVDGTEAILVTIESTTTSGFAGLQLVGNISDLCRDGKERAKTVLENLGYKMGHKRILINFSPADSRKEGNHFDLPIAISLAVLLSTKEAVENTKDWLFAAEIGLDGSLRPSRGIIPLILAAMKEGLNGVVISAENAKEVEALQQVTSLHGRAFRFLCFDGLEDVLKWLFEGMAPSSALPDVRIDDVEKPDDFDDMFLTPDLQRLALCFAIGRHSLLLRGSPGCGKSMFAQRLPCLLPAVLSDIHIDCLRIHSLVTDRIPDSILRGEPPFRSPHHTCSPQALLGTADQPGELSLAHGGILFLDELPEFRRDLLEALREPLETGYLNISRAHKKLRWHSRVQLIAACNNCPCGYMDSKRRLCLCSTQQRLNYNARLSGPLLERIDIHYRMPELKPSQFSKSILKQTHRLLETVETSRHFMYKRWGSQTDNASVTLDQIFESSLIDNNRRQNIMEDLEKLQVSSRSTLRLMRLARTLADIDRSEGIGFEHIREAAAFRP
ncbi:MAG: YifB family Mg chelatase-like AAA ATPase [Chitinophagaceae bacterium]|nr:YifB family Mg chelatase-like AAA ATPase [Oligoflexus sp.]